MMKGQKMDKSTKRMVLETIFIIILILFISSIINPVVVNGDSMNDTIKEDDIIIINKLSSANNINHDDIVVFSTDSGKKLIKRVIAVEDDYIEITNGYVYLNGKLLNEDYISNSYTEGCIPKTIVPKNTIFVLGDNRANSLDSRSEDIGFVNISKVVGKSFFRIYPLSSLSSM